ncbi:MAG: [protein-PII] uridylyltransferase [Nitrospirae bacterium GWC2_42_7]|nr:MAG: [protein-PII] uridylyltransferase [Nitrospirae bacterium GWC2_42_7]
MTENLTTTSCFTRGIFLKQIEEWIREGAGGVSLAYKCTDRIDLLLQDIFNKVSRPEGLVLIATGSYGRKELAPFSDIDIMVFGTDRTETETAEAMLYKLWDTGLDISHSFRTGRECIEDANDDIKTRTSLLEARYAAGDRNMYDIFRKEVYPDIAYKNQKDFVRKKLKEMQKRHSESGESVLILEPNIKEGEGGLRDVHTAYWLSKVAFRIENMKGFSGHLSPYEYKRFLAAYDFLLKTRSCLHFASQRKNDVLAFDLQKDVAKLLGFRDSLKFTAAERFMRYYYVKSKIIQDISHKLIVKCSKVYAEIRKKTIIQKITDNFTVSAGRLITTNNDFIAESADHILESFYLYSKTGKPFSDNLKENIRSNLLKINKRTRNSPAAVQSFTKILKSSRVYDTLREMHDSGVLGRFIPEFGALRWLVVHEPYHMYTVDEHTMLAIRNLELLKTSQYTNLAHLKSVMNGLESLNMLFMALLFHDIGKAVGRHHEEEGYKRLKNIMERFNFDSRKRARVEFLVKNHILMSRIALKRETDDIEVIAQFADAVEDMENLKAIYLITYADMSAVNRTFFNEWKLYLLEDLYLRTADYLNGIKEDRSEYIKELRSLSHGLDEGKIFSLLEEMPERYMLATTKKKVIEDHILIEQMKKSGFAMRIDKKTESVIEIIITAEDRPGLFSLIVGFLSSKGLNIVAGRIFTGKKGLVIDKISISNWNEVWWEGLQKDLEEGLRNIIVERKPLHVVRRKKTVKSLFNIFVEIDNESSDDYSLVEIFSPDRVGLLYDISDVMYRKDVNIVSARINTDAGLAHDVFYTQIEKKKVDNINAQELIAELWSMLN